ncbi:MAG: OmpA family protein [Nitrospiraceae bacterium]
MRNGLIPGTVICALLVTGCVSSGTHEATLAQLEDAKKTSGQTLAAFEEFKKKSAAEIEALQQDKARLANELLEAQSAATKTQQTLDETTNSLNSVAQARRDLEAEATRLRDENQEAQQMGSELRRERNVLQTQTDELQQQTVALQREHDLLQAKGDELQQQIAALQREHDLLQTKADELQGKAATLQKEREQLMIATGDQESQLKQVESEKARLEQERLAKEAEIQRLTQTHDDLTKQLQAEIAKGNIKIQQVRDKLTINMLEQVLFDSGQARIKPAGLKVLKQVSDILKTVNDKQIRIEGHTDNVPIGVKLQDRFPTNWELATARATSVVRYLIDVGGVAPAKLSAMGFADTHPIANNDTEQGRAANRRIEIILFPKDLPQIVSQIAP